MSLRTLSALAPGCQRIRHATLHRLIAAALLGAVGLTALAFGRVEHVLPSCLQPGAPMIQPSKHRTWILAIFRLTPRSCRLVAVRLRIGQ